MEEEGRHCYPGSSWGHVLQCAISQEPGGRAPAQPGIMLKANVRPRRTGKQAGRPAPCHTAVAAPHTNPSSSRVTLRVPQQASAAEAPPPLLPTLPDCSPTGKYQWAETGGLH